jgi:hypothetical protein
LTGGAALKVAPKEPFAGRDVAFALEGLQPWRKVTVEFVDPLGKPAEWVTEEETRFTPVGGVPVTSRALFADASGRAGWLRVGTLDKEGVWSLRVTVDGATSSVSYPVGQLQLAGESTVTVGVELRRFQGSTSDVYYSALVPATLAVDLQSQLAWVVGQLGQRLGIQSRVIPAIYLAGNKPLFEQLGAAVGQTIGFEAGFFKSSGVRPGIYMRTDSYHTELLRTLTHEYVHLVLDELANGRPLPAWLTEGMASFYEYELGLAGGRADATRLRLYGHTDRATAAARSGAFLPLTTLESQADWNSQRDDVRIDLQYSEAYMAVRFLTEKHGAKATVDMVREIGQGRSLENAIASVLGIHYHVFRAQMDLWLGTWEDPARAEIGKYTRPLQGTMDSLDAIFERRAADLASNAPLSSRSPLKRTLASDAASLLKRTEALSAPPSLLDMHQRALTFLERAVRWLTLEAEYAETLAEAKLVEANNMIPEITARQVSLSRDINDLQFVYNLAK